MFQTTELKRLVWPTAGHLAGTRHGRAIWLDAGARVLCVAMLTVPLAIGVDDAVSHSEASDDTPAALTGSTSTVEQTARSSDQPRKEWVIGGYTGSPYTYDSSVTLSDGKANDFQVDGVQWRGEPFIDPIYYGIRIQRWFEGGRTGSMLDFTHSKVIGEKDEDISIKGLLNGETVDATKKLGDVFRRLEFSHGHNMLTLNGLFRLADINPRLSPYIGIGAGVNLPHSEMRLHTGKRTYEYQYAGPVVQGLVGIEFRVPRLSYFLEYKFSFAFYDVPLSNLDGTEIGLFADLYRQAVNWWSDEPPPGGDLQTQLISHQIIGGLGFRIARPSPTDAVAP